MEGTGGDRVEQQNLYGGEFSVKITIIGGSKGTGAQLALAAVEAGHEVTVVSRSGNVPDGCVAVVGDAMDSAVVGTAVSGADAVVVTVGAAKGVKHARAAVTRSVVEAMQTVGVRRLVVQSSLGAGDSGSQLPVPLRQVMKVLLAKPLADHNEQEAVVRGSGLDWTIVRPTGLKNSPALGSWKALEVADGGVLGGTIPRADLAAFLMEVIGEEATVGKAFGISS